MSSNLLKLLLIAYTINSKSSDSIHTPSTSSTPKPSNNPYTIPNSLYDPPSLQVYNKLLSASLQTTCFIDPSDKYKLTCWGADYHGINRIPRMFNYDTNLVSVGPLHACAIAFRKQRAKEVGSQNYKHKHKQMQSIINYCWGKNVSGGTQLEDDKIYADLEVGMGFTVGVSQWNEDQHYNMISVQGKVIDDIQSSSDAWFDIEIPQQFTYDIDQVVTGITHVLIGKVYLICVGTNQQGECDVPASLNKVDSVRQKEAESRVNLLEKEKETHNQADMSLQIQEHYHDLVIFPSASAGKAHSCGLHQTRQLVCWGSNSYKQATVPRSFRTPLWFEVVSGQQHNCAFTINGFNCFGMNDFKQAQGQQQVSKDIKTFAAGGWHNCMQVGEGVWQNNDDKVQCWGANISNQCSIPVGINM